MSEMKLKPCPFCGGEANLKYHVDPEGKDFDITIVHCTNCSAAICGYGDLLIIRKWNERAFRIGRWKEVEGDYITPGGTPVYECAQCGGGQHLHGVEYPEQALVCPKCGSINLYPWEKVRWLEDE